ncbi:MAG: hypothetical protein HYZ08_01690 [Candidatus Kerfeldbacteria bacterium]|nr:hypothetical protein [Candidatus Kerfeldbacteria bacterium]
MLGLFPEQHQNGLEFTSHLARMVRVRERGTSCEFVFTEQAPDLSKLLARTPRRFRNGFIVLALPSEKIFLRRMHLEESGLGGLDRAVLMEASRHLPFPIEQLSMDWKVYREENGTRDLQFSAVPNEVLVPYLDLKRQYHVDIAVMEPEAMALVRAVIPESDLQNGHYLLCDLREDRLLMLLLRSGGIETSFVHADLGWDAIIARISQKTSQDREEIKKMLPASGWDGSRGKVVAALKEESERIIQVLSEAITFDTEHDEDHLEIRLSGYFVTIPGSTDVVQHRLSRPCTLATSAHHFPKLSKSVKRVEREPWWDIALGEALYRFAL